MRKIALRGLIGRKRDTLLLWSVVALAFLFLVLSTTLITSLQATDSAQRVQTYGSWQVMASGISRETSEQLVDLAETAAVLPMIPVSGDDYFTGDNNYYLSVYTPELIELGHLQLKEGRWPEERSEVVLEYARMASLGLEVGDTFTAMCQLQVPMTEEHIREKNALYYTQLEANQEAWRQQVLDLFRSGDLEMTSRGLRVGDELFTPNSIYSERKYAYMGYSLQLMIFPWWDAWHSEMTYLFADEEHPEGQDIPLEELTEEQFLRVTDSFLTMFGDSSMGGTLIPESTRVEQLLGYEDLSMRVKYEEGAIDENSMTLIILCKYTVSGVVETYTDRWDSGRLDLPSGFVTEENYQMLLGGQQMVVDTFPGFTAEDFDAITLLGNGANTSARSLWLETLPAYNAFLDQEDGIATVSLQACANTFVEANGDVHYSDPVKQLVFYFYLADEEIEDLRFVQGWLVPGEGNEDLTLLDGPLDTMQYDGLTDYIVIAMDDLVETSEDLVVFPAYNASYNYELRTDLDGAAVAFDYDGERYEIPLEEFKAGSFTVAGMRPVSVYHFWPRTADAQNDYTALRINRLSYPTSAESNENLLLLVMGILFVTTICAVFQICFTQVRRRLRRIVLLKSVGAEARQIAGMLGWEFLYIWLTSLAVGTGLGLGGAWGVSALLGRAQERDVLLTITPAVLLTALAAGTAALALGMCVPMVMAVGVPLTGRTARRRPLPPPKKETRQDFLHVTLRGLKARMGHTVGCFALCAFMMTIGVLCLFLAFQMLGEYRETVERDNKPDYLLRSPYAMSLRQREEYLQALEELGVCGEIESSFVTGGIDFDRAAWETSPLLTVAAGDTEEFQAESYPVSLYAIRSSDPLFQAYNDAATVGSLDAEAFDAGTQVLLMIPLYRDTGEANEEALWESQGWDRLAAAGIDVSYYAEFDGVYSRDTAVQVGDTLHLGMDVDFVSGMSYGKESTEAEVTVGAILYYFPGEGIWPVSGSREGYQIVGGFSLMTSLAPNAGLTRNLDSVHAIYASAGMFAGIENSGYGATDFYINAAEGVEREAADTALLIFARNHYMDIEVYYESSAKLLRDAVNNILLVCLLGLTAVLLALVIFFNTVTSDLEQERNRLGILQSLGVSNRQLALRQTYLGLAASGAALVLANLLLWGGVALYAAASGRVLANLLWGYPAAGHILLCIALAAALTLLYVLPMLRLRKYLPIDNIRSRK